MFAVSIPVWCDLELAQKAMPKAVKFVSIPVWCDLECPEFVSKGFPTSFQFQYGAIWSNAKPIYA